MPVLAHQSLRRCFGRRRIGKTSRPRPGRHQPANIDQPLRGDIRGLEDHIDKPEFKGPFRVDRLSVQHHAGRSDRAHQTGQSLRAPCARQQPQFDFRETEPGSRSCAAIVTGKSKFKPPSEDEARHRRNYRLVAGLDAREDVCEHRRHRRDVQFTDLSACDEIPAPTYDDYRLDRFIAFQPVDLGEQRRAHGLREGVDGRVVDDDGSQTRLLPAVHHVSHSPRPFRAASRSPARHRRTSCTELAWLLSAPTGESQWSRDAHR